ncbi:TIGR02678 family protein [Microbispora sp. NBC_01189]|uniref:TIGR02678 family protein n=1 Tax=Microbispora sp. NBC_01189 TaxID=2903583 RepID=UPI002E133601|nr:TIGR02678 family protein [Microbispora sp. NBC_01189]
MSKVAENVSSLELADYQRAVRMLLSNPLITDVHPNRAALPLIRRWADQLRADLHEVLGYRLVTTANTARLLRAQDELDVTRPARTKTDRPFDRRRYAYLVLTLAALGRSGTQIALSELAEAVSADAARIDGLGLDTERKPDRDAFVDAVAWLAERGALALADGSAADWVNNPDRAEALYDIDREVVFAIYRPSRVLQHMRSVTGLLDSGHGFAQGRHRVREAASRRARRLVLERPVVYYADVSEALRGQLRHPGLIEDLERLTGQTVERRAEGVALIDASGRLSDLRFPSGGTPSQAALLLSARIAAYVTKSKPPTLPAPTAAERDTALAARIDAGLPVKGVMDELSEAGPVEREAAVEAAVYPFVTDAWLRSAMTQLMNTYGMAFAVAWRGDPDRLLSEALNLLASLRLVARVEGGVLALPLLARYRGTTAEVRPRARRAQSQTDTLFDVEEAQ